MSTDLQPQVRGSATPIVLVHGDFGDGFDSWSVACERIGKRRRTVVVDRPGFGEDLPADAHFSIAGEARALLDALADMAIDSFHLVGHSYGGLIALEMAGTRPEIVRSLHLIEPPLLDLLPEEPDVREMDRHVRWIVESHAELGDEAATEAFFAMIGGQRMVERLRSSPDWMRLCTYATRFAGGEPASSYPSSSLARLTGEIPVALYTGGRSHPALRRIAVELASRIEGTRLVDVPEAGHAVQMAKEVFVDALFNLVQDADLGWRQRHSVARAEANGE
ncbi:MAG TPA: alpha/beta hydrolase [Thermomicrobiales bacterium]|nr:alpha/beta hydrolase [Thermomicrobiales bacterium]